MKAKELLSKSVEDLNKLLTEKREALRVFRFASTGAKSKNVKEGRAIRKDIARILTLTRIKTN